MENTNSNVWLAAALILVVVIAGLWIANGNNVSEDETKDIVAAEIAKLNIPTATEIASEIVIEVPEWEAPVIPEFESDEKVSDLWDNLYALQIEALELNAEEVATFELEDLIEEAEDEEDGAFFDFLKANIEGFDELRNVDIEEVEVTILELGLEDDEDKVAEVVFELKIRYTLESGIVQRYKDDVIATANVVFEEGDFGDEEVDLVFAF